MPDKTVFTVSSYDQKVVTKLNHPLWLYLTAFDFWLLSLVTGF